MKEQTVINWKCILANEFPDDYEITTIYWGELKARAELSYPVYGITYDVDIKGDERGEIVQVCYILNWESISWLADEGSRWWNYCSNIELYHSDIYYWYPLDLKLPKIKPIINHSYEKKYSLKQLRQAYGKGYYDGAGNKL